MFSQNWDFFTPPPTYDHRLYYTFFPDTHTVYGKTFEILEPLNKAKRDNSPFNSDEDVVDYLLSTSVISLDHVLAQEKNVLMQLYPDSTDVFHKKTAYKNIQASLRAYAGYQTLLNYSRIVCSTQKVSFKDSCRVKIASTVVPLPKFNDRFSIVRKQELLVIETPIVKIY